MPSAKDQPEADAFRAAALAMPQAVEAPHFDATSFRIAGKIFAQMSADRQTGLVKLTPGLQEWATITHPEFCSVEPSWGKYGWTRVRLAGLPDELRGELLAASWRAVAPKLVQERK
jgi:hypothetical protein